MRRSFFRGGQGRHIGSLGLGRTDAVPWEESMESEGVETPLGALGREKATTEPARQLEAVLANIAEGVNIVDAEGRVVLVNEGFMRLYGFPPHLAAPGTPIAAFVRHRLGEEAAALAEGYDVEAVVAERVQELLDAGSGELKETLPDGRVVWIRRQRLPDGLLVSTYGDVTEQKRHEEWLALLATAVEQEGDSVELADADIGCSSSIRRLRRSPDTGAKRPWGGRPPNSCAAISTTTRSSPKCVRRCNVARSGRDA
jgi:PAS domain-containing protein